MLGIDQSLPPLFPTGPWEECYPGITFDVPEFIFDEENNCSNEARAEVENISPSEEGEAEEDEEEMDDGDSYRENQDSDQLESDY